MSALPDLMSPMTPAASGAGMILNGTLILRAISLTMSATGPVMAPVCASTCPCTGFAPRNAARKVPVGARSAAVRDTAAQHVSRTAVSPRIGLIIGARTRECSLPAAEAASAGGETAARVGFGGAVLTRTALTRTAFVGTALNGMALTDFLASTVVALNRNHHRFGRFLFALQV